MAASPTFTIRADRAVGETLVVGATHPGIASLSAVDHLVTQADFERCGRVDAEGFPTIAPFEDGTPRHPFRLYGSDATGLTVLVAEAFVPVWAARAFARGIVDWIGEASIETVTVLYGVPYPHGPEEHRAATVTTPAYRERLLSDADIPSLPGGVLDGVVGELLVAALGDPGFEAGALVTPSHPPGPDLEAAIVLLEALETVHGIELDLTALEDEAERLRQHYAELANHVQALEEGGRSSQEFPEDRMFM